MTAARPTTIDQAVDTLAAHPHLVPVCGGTDVMVGVNDGRLHVAGWISLRGITSLRGVDDRRLVDGTLALGSATSFADLLAPAHAGVVPASLAAAARSVGSPQIRAAGSLGGNVATASPAADSVPALLCHDAEVELAGPFGRRRVPLRHFAVGPKRTVRRPDELITAIHLTSLGGVDAFAKVGTRNAMVIAVCSVAARLDPDRGVARVALGSVGPTVLTADGAEAALLDPRGRDDFVDAVRATAAPIDDVRSTARYRRHAVGVLAARMHGWLWAELTRSAA